MPAIPELIRCRAAGWRTLSRVVALACLAPLMACADEGDNHPIAIADPYLRETPPGQAHTAGFFVATNRGASDCPLVAASAPGIDRLELHEHRHENGVMRMRQVEQMIVPAGGTLELAPGGYHLMVHGLSAPLAAGDSVDILLDFGDCGSRTVSFSVIDPRR